MNKYLTALFFLTCLFASSIYAQTGGYGPPYYYNSHGTRPNGPFNTVAETEAAWWSDWTSIYVDAAVYCSYTPWYAADIQPFAAPPSVPIVGAGGAASMTVFDTTGQGRCGGTNVVFATPYTFSLEKNLGDSCETDKATCGNPINVAIGNKYQRESDFSFGSLLRFERHYNSYSSPGTVLLRNNWTNTYSRRIEFPVSQLNNPRNVDVSRPDGKTVKFVFSSGVWSASRSEKAKIHRINDANGLLAGWTFTEEDTRQVEQYDAKGRLIGVSNSDGESAVLIYNNGSITNNESDYLPTLITDEKGRSLAFTYENFRLIKIVVPDGSEYTYTYDLDGRLDKAIFPGGRFKQYHYNEQAYTNNSNLPNALTGITDEKGQRYSIFQYASDGRPVSTEHSGGVDKFSVQYLDDTTDGVVITDPLGKVETRRFVTLNGVRKLSSTLETTALGSRFQSFTYDANGRRDVTTDYRDIDADIYVNADTDFNERGLLTQKIETPGQITKRTSQTDWHTTFNVPRERRVLNAANTLEAKTQYAQNARGQTTAMCQIDPSNATAMAYVCGSAADAPPGVRQSVTAYCEQADVTSGVCPIIGLSKSANGPRVGMSDITTYTYYQTDDATCATAPTTCPHRKGDMWKVTNAAGHVTEYTRYDGAGRALQMKDANGVVTDMEYNARGWLTARKVRGLDDTGEFYDDAITRIEYDPAGQVTRVMQPDGYLLGDYIDFTYDAAHRLTGLRDALGNSATYTLDNAGNRTAETTKDPNGVVMRSLSRVYDTLGRLQASRNAADQPTVSMTYDANDNLDITTDGLGRVTNQDVDPLNRLIKTIQDQGVGKINAVTQFEYDSRDNLTKVIDPKNLNTSYAYNGLNDLVQLSSPDTGIATYTYDEAGNRKTQTDARNIVTTYSYDALNRLTQVAYPTASLNSNFTYDAINAICGSTEAFAKGRLTQFADPSGSTQYCYDRFGNMTRKQTINNGVTSVFVFAYTRAGRLSSLTYPSGMKVNYLRNAVGQTVQVSITQGTTTKVFANNIAYYPFGPLSRIEFLPANSPNTNPAVVGPVSNAAGRVTTRAAAPGGGCTPRPGGCTPVPPTTPIVQTRVYDQDYAVESVGGLSYQIDRLGNIESVVDSLGGNTFSYDNLDRLTNVRNSSTAADMSVFTYDATGNRLTKKTGAAVQQAYTYPAASHRLENVDGTARVLDANGNTTQIGTNQYFTYDARNRMVDFRSSSNTIVRIYQYNAKGERVRKYRNITTHASYLYDEAGKLLSETKKNLLGNTVVQEIIWLDDMPIGLSQNGALHGILTDHLNTPRQVFLVSTQATQWRWDLADNAFGEKPAIATGVDMDLRFPGQLYDAESGLHYNYFRDYEPGVGRYVESDSVGLLGGVSTYSYVISNPIKFIDLLGLTSTCPLDDKVKCPYEGRYQPCCNGWFGDATWIGNWARYKLCKKSVDKACGVGNKAVCCKADFKACNDGNDIEVPRPSSGTSLIKYTKCYTEYLACMAKG